MKKIYLSLLAVAGLATTASAQTPCSTGRYSSDVYTTYTVTSGIAYGQNTTFSGSTQTLTLDFYQPAADTAHARPLIIWAHGGSFIGGTSTDVDVQSLSEHFAKKGYACASINYRLGFYPIDSVHAIPAVVRAVQDMKAAIRFFYKDKLTANTYKIDTNNIFIAGSSAGAITALHVAYLDKGCELTPYVDPASLAALGGLEGTSGNPNYSTKVKGVINLCGALAKYAWMEAGDLPLCSMHGTVDGTVKYSQGVVNPGVPLMYLDGSRMLYKRAQCLGVANNFYTWNGADHVPYAGTSATQLLYMDTTVNFVRDYLVGRLGCTNAVTQPANTPFGNATLYPYTSCSVSITDCPLSVHELEANNLLQEVYPNPSTGDVKVVFVNNNTTHTLTLSDVSGKILKSETTSESTYTLEKNNIAPGVYFLKATNSKGEASVKKLIFY